MPVTIITNLFSAIPLIGDAVVTWLWGGFSVDNALLNRFYSLHYLLPFVIVAVVMLHLVALHTHGSGNPLGIDTKGTQDSIPFHPYYTVKGMRDVNYGWLIRYLHLNGGSAFFFVVYIHLFRGLYYGSYKEPRELLWMLGLVILLLMMATAFMG